MSFQLLNERARESKLKRALSSHGKEKCIMSESAKRPNKKPEKNTVISQMVGADSKPKKRGRNGSKQHSIYLTDEHIKAIGLRDSLRECQNLL